MNLKALPEFKVTQTACAVPPEGRPGSEATETRYVEYEISITDGVYISSVTTEVKYCL